MGILVHWRWIAVLSCVFLMGAEVWCHCSNLNLNIEGGHYKLTKQFERGSKLIYHCPPDYYPHPEIERECMLDGRWKPAPKRFRPQKCKLIECPDPNVLEYGNVSPPQEKYYIGNETTYECYSGYTMEGSARRFCMRNGKWSGKTPICRQSGQDVCADPGIPPGASRRGNIFGIDDKVIYSCSGNLLLVGSKERVCQEDGRWTGHEPACYFRYTYDTPEEVSEEFASGIKDTLTILKPTNDTQSGKKIRISKDGTLNIYIAVDISDSIFAEDFAKSKEAVLTLLEKISVFTVTPNYEIVFFSSEVIEKVNILDYMDKNVENPLNNIKNELRTFNRTDQDSGTNLNAPFEKFLEKMQYMKANLGEKNFTEHRHVIIIFTDGVYNMGGSPLPTVEKIKNLVYLNSTSEEKIKSRLEYLDIYVFAIGNVTFDEDLQPLAVGDSSRHYFKMKEIKKLTAAFDEMIDEGDDVGLCGLYKTFQDPHKENKREMFPWFTFIYVKGKKDCVGSMVNSRFFLTAAHCFPPNISYKEVKIKINKTVYDIEKFYIHEKYNLEAKQSKGIKEFYDYDVALIQLKVDLNFSTSLRPICIPCTQQTSDALKLGKTTCADQERALFKENDERLSFLTETSGIVDEADVYAKIANRHNCIKKALGSPGIPSNINVTEVVTDNFLCTGGLDPNTNDISCKGDSGGALFKTVQYRMIQVGVVSWGTTLLPSCKNKIKPEKPVRSSADSRDFHINLFKVVDFLKRILGNDDQEVYAPMTFLD